MAAMVRAQGCEVVTRFEFDPCGRSRPTLCHGDGRHGSGSRWLRRRSAARWRLRKRRHYACLDPRCEPARGVRAVPARAERQGQSEGPGTQVDEGGQVLGARPVHRRCRDVLIPAVLAHTHLAAVEATGYVLHVEGRRSKPPFYGGNLPMRWQGRWLFGRYGRAARQQVPHWRAVDLAHVHAAERHAAIEVFGEFQGAAPSSRPTAANLCGRELLHWRHAAEVSGGRLRRRVRRRSACGVH
mmetsp:Transcript_106697/g.299799  ORF Transcript_106697/g.299799 Transcript_106697/m.299799 type:complete len:241 (-) Transcript_106697:953-1675(-)